MSEQNQNDQAAAEAKSEQAPGVSTEQAAVNEEYDSAADALGVLLREAERQAAAVKVTGTRQAAAVKVTGTHIHFTCPDCHARHAIQAAGLLSAQCHCECGCVVELNSAAYAAGVALREVETRSRTRQIAHLPRP